MPENKPKRTYEEVQAEINSKLIEKKAYQSKVLKAIESVEKDPDKVSKLKNYVNNLTIGADEKERRFCIGSACYTLNQAGELLKYSSNASLEKDITSGKLKGYHYDYKLNDVEPGDILQLNHKTVKNLRGAPYHGMLVKKVEKDKSGNVTAVEYYGSQGSAESFGTHRIEGVALDNYRADKTSHEVIKKDFIPNSLYAERDMVKPFVKPIVKKYLDYTPNEQIKYLGSNDESEDKKKNREEYINKMMGRKEELMRAYNLSNNEYNDLVKVSAGIIDQESEYGTSARYKAKSIPGVQFAGKILKGDIVGAFSPDEYSTGAGQIKEKYFPSEAGKKFGITPDSKEATLLTVLDRYSTQVPSKLKETPAAYLKTANVYKGMSSDNNEYAQSVLNKASSFGLPNYNESKASLIDIKNKERANKQEMMKQSFAPVVKQENFVNVKKEPVVKFRNGGWLDGLEGVDKGTQVPDAAATAKPIVNLKFAVTPAQKQLAAKNKRQAEVDMQVDHPEFYTNSNFLDKKAVKPYSVEDYKKGIKEPGLQTPAVDPIDLVGTGAYKGLAKALGAKEVAVAADAALFNSLDKSKVLYNQVKSKAKDEIYKLKYKKDIASLESKKFNAMQKMNNPEGWKRLREQGIEPKQFFDQLNKSKITSTRNTGSWDNGAQINIDFDQVKKLQKEGYDLSVDNIIDHEIGHRMQRGFNSKAVKDYNQAKSYNYKIKVPEYHVYSTPLDKDAELLLSPVIKNPNENSNYFLFGSDNKERLPFLREAKESMVSKGFINNIYSKITPETVKKFLKEVPSNRFSTFLDVENPITHRRLSGLLNKTPIMAGAGLGVNELAKDKKQNGGWLDNLK